MAGNQPIKNPGKNPHIEMATTQVKENIKIANSTMFCLIVARSRSDRVKKYTISEICRRHYAPPTLTKARLVLGNSEKLSQAVLGGVY
jgi:hypothetical protein